VKCTQRTLQARGRTVTPEEHSAPLIWGPAKQAKSRW